MFLNFGCSTITYDNYNDIMPEMFQIQINRKRILHKINKNRIVLFKKKSSGC